MRIDPLMTQKEETFQVILDIIKASPCYNAFLITADVPGIYLQQFWFTVKKIKKTTFYEFDLAIPDTMLTDKIKQSEAYKAFIGYSTRLIPPKKSKGKGSQGKKHTITSKKKSSISANDNTILEPDVAFELGKLISKTKAEISKEERRLHETHEHLITAKPTGDEESDESDGEPAYMPTGRRRPFERLAADTKKAIKASKEAHILQQQTEDLSKGAGITPEVLDELTGKFTTLSEGSGIVLEVPDEVHLKTVRAQNV
ncbi:hypothetical protein Tco_0484557 [Tanacetum coccineum]